MTVTYYLLSRVLTQMGHRALLILTLFMFCGVKVWVVELRSVAGCPYLPTLQTEWIRAADGLPRNGMGLTSIFRLPFVNREQD